MRVKQGADLAVGLAILHVSVILGLRTLFAAGQPRKESRFLAVCSILLATLLARVASGNAVRLGHTTIPPVHRCSASPTPLTEPFPFAPERVAPSRFLCAAHAGYSRMPPQTRTTHTRGCTVSNTPSSKSSNVCSSGHTRLPRVYPSLEQPPPTRPLVSIAPRIAHDLSAAGSLYDKYMCTGGTT